MPDLSTITPVTREEEFLDRIARAAASPNLPEVDTSDNGDVLTVVSGEWAAAAPPEGLPEVTSSNNGQVLTVVSGEWAAAAPAGGGLLSVTVTEESGGDVWRMNKTFNEIKTAFISGTPIIVRFPDSFTDGKYCIVSEVVTNLAGEPLEPSSYYVYCTKDDNFMLFSTLTADGYPEYAWI